jgi:hypothetical protein
LSREGDGIMNYEWPFQGHYGLEVGGEKNSAFSMAQVEGVSFHKWLPCLWEEHSSFLACKGCFHSLIKEILPSCSCCQGGTQSPSLPSWTSHCNWISWLECCCCCFENDP